MTIHKPQPKFGWYGEAEPIETYETRPISLEEPRGRAEYVPDNHMEWLPDEKTQSQFDDTDKRIYINGRAPSQIIPDDLVAQLRGGPITSPWIERAKSVLQETNARRAVARGEPGSVELGSAYREGDTVFVGPPLA